MHFNRKKISQPKLKISPRYKKNKNKAKVSREMPKAIASITKPKKKSRFKIRTSAMNNSKFDDKSKYKPMSEWSNLLKGETAFILGNAPSISKHNLDLLKPYFTIGVNRIFYLFTPTILIWQDIQLWNKEKRDIIKQKSIRICTKISDPRNTFLHFRVKQGGFKFKNNPKVLNGTGNTGILAVQVAINLGCSNIVLLGTDCKYAKNKTDFYGKNRDHKPYTLQMCEEAMEYLRDNSPVPIYNCSKNRLWPRRELSEVIKQLDLKKKNRKIYQNIFKKKEIKS
jgi:hypothetical protein